MEITNKDILLTPLHATQADILNELPPLSREQIYMFISLSKDGSDERTLHVVDDIIKNKHTIMGWRDYVYCFYEICESVSESKDYYVQVLLTYVSKLVCDANTKVMIYLALFFGCRLLCRQVSRDTLWYHYTGGTWTRVETTSIVNSMFTHLCKYKVLEVFKSKDSSLGGVFKLCTASMKDSITRNILFMPHFEEMCDNKHKAFTMPNSTYDITYCTLRVGLPSDLSTLSSSYDPDKDKWTYFREEMLCVFDEWLSGREVTNTYLDILASAISEFKPRYSVINSGTGSDGKSTLFLILSAIFGGYCATMPGSGPSLDSKNSNDATPVANLLVGKRLCLTADVANVVRLIESSGFKSITGGDMVYLRGLHKEARETPSRLKMLCITNTNQESIVVTTIHSLTRIKIFRWLRKTITDEDKAIIPSHQLTVISRGKFNYEQEFLSKYGQCLLTELLVRHGSLTLNNRDIVICDKVREWTKELVSPKIILSFLEACTTALQTSTDTKDMDGIKIWDLYVLYTHWRKGNARSGPSDPNTLEVFKSHVAFYHPVVNVVCGTSTVPYVLGIEVNPEYQALTAMYNKGGQFSMGIGSFLANTSSAAIYEDNRPTYQS